MLFSRRSCNSRAVSLGFGKNLFFLSPQLNMNVILYVAPELKDLYAVLESDFQPLELWTKAEPMLEWLKGQVQFNAYVDAFEYVIAMRVLKQVRLHLFFLCVCVLFLGKDDGCVS